MRLGKLRGNFDMVDSVKDTSERKTVLESLAREIQKCNGLVKEVQFEIKRVPEKEAELNKALQQLRTTVNEWEENINEKKKKFKYEILLSD